MSKIYISNHSNPQLALKLESTMDGYTQFEGLYKEPLFE